MCCANNGIYMNHIWFIIITAYHPHACILARWVTDCWEPFDNGTWVCDSVIFELDESQYLCGIHATKPRKTWIVLDKDTVTPLGSTAPWLNWANALAKHAAKTRQVTWCMVCRNCWWIEINLLREERPLGHVRMVIQFRMLLRVEESWNEQWERWDLQPVSKWFYVLWNIGNYCARMSMLHYYVIHKCTWFPC